MGTTMNMANRVRAALLVSLAVAAAIDTARAQQAQPGEREQTFELGLTTGGSWSDNIGRVPADEDEGSLGLAGVILGYRQRSARLEADVDANVVYEHYFDDTFDDDLLGGIDGTVRAEIVPERLSWFVQDNFGQIASDPFSADRPDNREDINYFTTGPDFTFRLGSAMSVLLSGRYSNTAYETSELDGERLGGTVALSRELSGNSSFSLNATTEQVEFDNTTFNTDYDRHQGFLRYDARGSRTTLTIDAGYTSLDTGTDTPDAPLARISVTRQVSASSTFTLRAGSEYSSGADLFRDTQGAQGAQLSGQSIVATNDPFEYRFGALEWDFNRNRTTIGLALQHGKEEYETLTQLDRTLTSFNAYFTRQVSRTAELRLFGAYEDEQFDELDGEDQELQLGAALAWDVGRTLEVRVQLDHFDRDSSNVLTEYTENRASVFLTWFPIGRQ
ncbi:MAG: outer membrane beta-barrel protein [Steroidobacteraceae bacterium]